MNIDELQARKEELSVQINAAIQANDTPTAARLQQEYQEVQAQINQAEVDTASDAIAPSTEEIKVGDDTYSIDFLASGPDEAMIIRQFLRQLRITAGEQASANIATVQTLESRIADLEDRNGALELRARDAESKRDAAVVKSEELQREVERLNGHIDDLRKDIAVGATNAANVIELDSDEAIQAASERLKAKKAAAEKAAKEAAEAAKIRIYDVQPGDTGTTFYKAKRADNDEPIEIRPYFAINQYVVITDPEELARFREEHKAANEAAEAELLESVPVAETSSEPVMPEVPSFRNDEATQAQPTDGLAGDETHAQVEGVSRQEFEALKAEVYEIKARMDSPAFAVWGA